MVVISYWDGGKRCGMLAWVDGPGGRKALGGFDPGDATPEGGKTTAVTDQSEMEFDGWMHPDDVFQAMDAKYGVVAMNQIASFDMTIAFQDGHRAVFGVGSDMRLHPVVGDGIVATASQWERAAEWICSKIPGIKPPSPEVSVTTPVRTAWPWSKEEEV